MSEQSGGWINKEAPSSHTSQKFGLPNPHSGSRDHTSVLPSWHRHSFIHWFIQTQFPGASSGAGAVEKLGITWSPIPKHEPLRDWLEKGWIRAASNSGAREAQRVTVGVASPEGRARTCREGFPEELPLELGWGSYVATFRHAEKESMRTLSGEQRAGIDKEQLTAPGGRAELWHRGPPGKDQGSPPWPSLESRWPLTSSSGCRYICANSSSSRSSAV